MQYKYKIFWIEIVDIITDWCEDTPMDTFRYNVYYNGICAATGTRPTETLAKQGAEYWVDKYGYEWLQVE